MWLPAAAILPMQLNFHLKCAVLAGLALLALASPPVAAQKKASVFSTWASKPHTFASALVEILNLYYLLLGHLPTPVFSRSN